MVAGECIWVSAVQASLIMACYLVLNLKYSNTIEKTGYFASALNLLSKYTIACYRDHELIEVKFTIFVFSRGQNIVSISFNSYSGFIVGTIFCFFYICLVTTDFFQKFVVSM